MNSRSNRSDSADNGSPAVIALYFASLWLALGLGMPGSGLATIPIQFFLKDRLHLAPQTVAWFGAVTSIPLYLGFLFGFLRDRWQPLGRGDRGYLVLAAPLALLTYGWLAAGAITYARLLAAILLAAFLFQVLATSVQALTTVVAQERLMTGRLGVVMTAAQLAPMILAALAGGWMVQRISAPGIFGITGAATALLWLLAFWKPRAVFTGEAAPAQQSEGSMSAVRRLLRHRPLWPAAAIMFLWNFSPGLQTPLLYHFTNTLKISGEAFGLFWAILFSGFLPTAVLYGVLCRRVPLRNLLWWGTAFAVIQVLPVLAVHNTLGVMLFGAAAGLLGGFATAAFFDLLFRACPKGLEGTGSMLAMSAFAVAVRSGDLFGTWLYQRGGFTLAILITTAVYALMIPTLCFVPPTLVATREGERAPEEAPAIPLPLAAPEAA